jgi:hypothetical protein
MVGEVFPESKMLLAAHAKGKDPFSDVLREPAKTSLALDVFDIDIIVVG